MEKLGGWDSSVLVPVERPNLLVSDVIGPVGFSEDWQHALRLLPAHTTGGDADAGTKLRGCDGVFLSLSSYLNGGCRDDRIFPFL